MLFRFCLCFYMYGHMLNGEGEFQVVFCLRVECSFFVDKF